MTTVSSKVIIGDSRKMLEVESNQVDLVITSPPYWNIKDYKAEGQIGYGQSLHEYLKDLFVVWKECFRVLSPGSRLCINVGDQFLRSADYGRYKVVPIHAEITTQCDKIGFDYLGSIIWQKKTTMNTTGGATVMGSYPYPPNGLIEIDYEFILVFKKLGKKVFTKDAKQESKLTKEEWKKYFLGHWNFAGEKQKHHEAMFPEELPRRLIKMFSFIGDTVLDPFLGSGTTNKVSLELERNSIGFELNEDFLPIIQDKIDIESAYPLFQDDNKVEIIERSKFGHSSPFLIQDVDYIPSIQNIEPVKSPRKVNSNKENLYRVTRILNENTVELGTGLRVELLGIDNVPEENFRALGYLEKFVKGKQVFLKFDPAFEMQDNKVQAYLFLKNKIFINKEMIKLGMSKIPEYSFKYKDSFIKLTLDKSNGERVDIK